MTPIQLPSGEVPERLNGPVSKTGVPSGTAGSNPALSGSIKPQGKALGFCAIVDAVDENPLRPPKEDAPRVRRQRRREANPALSVHGVEA